MTLAELLVFASIALSVICWAIAEASRSRAAWLAGAVLACIHSVAAFGLFYGWSHGTAARLTTEQTVRLTGVEFGGGIYVNYVFLAVWLMDALWWSLSPQSYRARPRAVSASIHSFIFFIIVNGAVVFADGLARLLGIASVALVLAVRGWRIARPWRVGMTQGRHA